MVAGSKSQARGSDISPSCNPSRSSQAASTASERIGSRSARRIGLPFSSVFRARLPGVIKAVELRQVHGRCACHDTVKILWIALSFHKGLSSSGRASAEVRILCGLPVELLDQRLRNHGGHMRGAVGEIDTQLGVITERTAWALVPHVRRRQREVAFGDRQAAVRSRNAHRHTSAMPATTGLKIALPPGCLSATGPGIRWTARAYPERRKRRRPQTLTMPRS